MKRSGGLLLSCLVLALFPAIAAESTNRINFPVAGFSIQTLETPLGEAPQMPLSMSLPSRDGFAGNVNVLIQPFTGTLDEYMKQSEAQFKSAGISILKSTRPNDSSATLEYFGRFQGRMLHWYARVELAKGRIYLITATTAEDRWKEDAEVLQSCVDSFRRPQE